MALPFGINYRVAYGERPPQLEQTRVGDQIDAAGRFAHEIDRAVRGDSQRLRPDPRQRHQVGGNIGKRKHGRARNGTAGTQVLLRHDQPHPDALWRHLFIHLHRQWPPSLSSAVRLQRNRAGRKGRFPASPDAGLFVSSSEAHRFQMGHFK